MNRLLLALAAVVGVAFVWSLVGCYDQHKPDPYFPGDPSAYPPLTNDPVTPLARRADGGAR